MTTVPMNAAKLLSLLAAHVEAGRFHRDYYEELAAQVADLSGKDGRVARERAAFAKWEDAVQAQEAAVAAGMLPVSVLRESVACLRTSLSRLMVLEGEERHMVMALWDALARAIGRVSPPA